MVTVVTYQGYALIVPKSIGTITICACIDAGLKIDPTVKRILWNDRIVKFDTELKTITVCTTIHW